MITARIAAPLALLLALAVTIPGARARSIEEVWGLESSTSEKKSGDPVPALDGYSDKFRGWESTGPYAEQQGVYRETLKKEPVCYDPRRPERMPWYIEREYEWRTTVVLDTVVWTGASIAWGRDISFSTNFTVPSQTLGQPSCGSGLQWLTPHAPVSWNTACAADTTLEVFVVGSEIWVPVGSPDYSYTQQINQMPSCANGLVGSFYIRDTKSNCDRNKWGLGHRWAFRFLAKKTELVDVTPPHTECFYP